MEAKDKQVREWMLCNASPVYFCHNYCTIYEAASGSWIPFSLWPEQAQTLMTINSSQLTVILKARQLGCTWLCLSYALWQMLFRSVADVLLFSRRDDEAVHLLDERLKGMYRRLPVWMQARKTPTNNNHMFGLSNGSIARAFPTNAGDSYTASLAIVDEADLVPELNKLMRSVKPTIDTGGKMVLLSRSDKEQPLSEFKQIYRASQSEDSPWTGIFLPWYVRPERTQEWYDTQRKDVLARTGSLDDLYEQYPATAEEALSLKELDRRIPISWLRDVHTTSLTPCEDPGVDLKPRMYEVAGVRNESEWQASQALVSASSWLEHVRLYTAPIQGHEYVIGADPAEGNPTSDDSVAHVVDLLTGDEQLILVGKLQPEPYASYVHELSLLYNQASILVERNNHGHTVILKLKQLGAHLLNGTDGKPGWLTTKLSKALMYNTAVEYIREKDCIIRDLKTFYQLSSIEGATLNAPKDAFDDYAVSWCLAMNARSLKALTTFVHIRPGNTLYDSQERSRGRRH